jgi:hypothetical protein
MNLDLINERYTDSKYESYFLLKEHWNSYTDSQKRFIKECEDITNFIFPELLQEGPLDKARSRAAGAWTGAKNLKKSLTGRGFTKKQGSEIEDVGQVKLNHRVKLFQKSIGKVLGELQRDLGKMGIQGEDHPTIQAMNYITGSAGQIGTEQYPIEVKAGFAGRKADEALEWTNTKVQKILTDIKAAADQAEQQEFPGMETFKLSDSIKKSAGKSLQAIEAFAKKNPKWTNFAIGALVAASRLAGIPGSGVVVGLLLRSTVGVIKGEDIQQAVGNAAKVATVGAVAGAAIGELGDALSNSPEQVAGALDQAGDAGEDVIRQSPDFDADPNTDFAGGTDVVQDISNVLGDQPDMTQDLRGYEDWHRELNAYFDNNPDSIADYEAAVRQDYIDIVKDGQQSLGVPEKFKISTSGGSLETGPGAVKIDPSNFPGGEVTPEQLENIRDRYQAEAEVAQTRLDHSPADRVADRQLSRAQRYVTGINKLLGIEAPVHEPSAAALARQTAAGLDEY